MFNTRKLFSNTTSQAVEFLRFTQGVSSAVQIDEIRGASEFSVDWGDGVVDNFIGDKVSISHSYATQGVHEISVKSNDYLNVTALSMIAASNVTSIYMNPDLNKLTSLSLILLDINSFEISSKWVNLDSLVITSNFNLSYVSIPSQLLNLTYITLTDNALPAAVLNDVLSELDQSGVINCELSMQGITNGTPTNITAVNSLLAKNWTIRYNGFND